MAIAFPTAATVGEKYIENEKIWEWNGTAWNKMPAGDVLSSDSAPSLPFDGQLWIDTDSGGAYYYDSNNGWLQLVSGAVNNPAITINHAMIIGSSSAPQTATQLYNIQADSIANNGLMLSNRVYSVSGSDYYNALVIWGQTNTNIERKSIQSNADAVVVAQADINNMSTDAAGAGNNNSLIVNKAFDMTNISGTQLFRYSHSNGTEYTHGNLQVRRSYATATANYTDVLFISGSRDTTFWLNSVEKCQIVANNTAVMLPNISNARTRGTAVNDFDNVIYCYGADTGGPPTNNFTKMNFAAESQQDFVPTGAIARKSVQGVANDTDGLFFGGRDTNSTRISDVAKINFDSLSFQASVGSLLDAVSNHTATYGN